MSSTTTLDALFRIQPLADIISISIFALIVSMLLFLKFYKSKKYIWLILSTFAIIIMILNILFISANWNYFRPYSYDEVLEKHRLDLYCENKCHEIGMSCSSRYTPRQDYGFFKCLNQTQDRNCMGFYGKGDDYKINVTKRGACFDGWEGGTV